ncbi:DMT family transporter [Planctomycetota bacterium]
MTAAPRLHPFFVLTVAVLAVSTASTFIIKAQDAGVHSLAIAAWRLTLASLILTPLAFIRCRKEIMASWKREWPWLILSGICLAAHFGTWVWSLEFTSVAASVVLVTLYPLFVGLGGWLFFGEPFGGRMILGGVLAVAGSIIISVSDASGTGHGLRGDLLAFIGMLAVTAYFLIGKRLRRGGSLMAYIYPVYTVAAVTLLASVLIGGIPMTGFRPMGWAWLICLTLVCQLVGHSSLNWALAHLPAAVVTLPILAEPVGAVLLAWVFLREAPPLWVAVGGMVVLGGLYAALRSRRSSSP